MSAGCSGGSFPDAAQLPAAVVVAGGAGTRLGGAVRKQYLELRGRPVLRHALQPFLEHPGIGCVVVVLPPADAAEPPAWLHELEVSIVAGGTERRDSVRNGLAATPPTAPAVLIHDGARPFVSAAIIDRVLAAIGSGGAIAALPVTDTIKEVDADHIITGTPQRSRLWQAQTPQGFPRALLVEAHERARRDGFDASDDAALVERLGARVAVVEGGVENIKITRAVDLLFAEALASQLLVG